MINKRPETKEDAQEFLEKVNAAPSVNRYSIDNGMVESTTRRWVTHCNRLIETNISIPDGLKLKGTSFLHDPNTGEKKIEWVKTTEDKERQEELLQETIAALKEDIPREKPSQANPIVNDSLLSCYVLTDYHMGMLSWAGETGDDWSTDIATSMLVNWFKAAIDAAPSSHTAVLAQLGDFLHYDSLEAVTPASGHVLDADSRYPQIVRAAIRGIRVIVQMLLEKHENVHIIMAEGNHDLSSSVWLRELFYEKYADDPRVTVDDSNTPFYAYEFGDTSLFFHHGHKRSVNNSSSVFAGMYREIFGRTQYSYAHLGHKHHVDVKEDNLMIVEQHPTLAAKDAYATRGGWLSKRGASVITYHKEYGEVSRSTIRPEMVS